MLTEASRTGVPWGASWRLSCTVGLVAASRLKRTQAAQGVDSMATRSDTTRETANAAASEAMRATSEASRRTLQGAQDIMRTTSAYLAQSTEANRKLFNAYAHGIEATLKGGFEVQNAVF